MRKWLYAFILVAATVLLLLKAGDRLARRAGPLPAAPSPNAYEGLLRVASELSALEKEPSEMSRETTMRVAEGERAKLEPVHALVRTNSAVPLQTVARWGELHAADIRKLKRLSVALGMQARAHELAGRTNEAAGPLVDMIALGQQLTRGGVYVDGVNGLLVETIGVGMLRAKVQALDAATCRMAAREIEGLEGRRETPEAILERERAWSHASFGLVSRVGGWLRREADAERNAKFLEKYYDGARRTRRLILALAGRAWELEKGERAAKPGDLVPGILQRVPVDPATKGEMTEMPVSDSER